ncbi:hypothetical protein [Litoreibacter halocynthiae]|uniref:hypothetical protein n=1 Tax=Litoreibacter halocynthiae TaxID=1242689 RepID=UPI00248F9FE8|nr:hypothetical protein [Litoreibacter halocynthiae]
MDEVMNVGETILLDGESLSIVTRAGVEAWVESGTKYSRRYDRVRDPVSGEPKHRCLYEKDGVDIPYVLVSDPDSDEGPRVILFDQESDASQCEV